MITKKDIDFALNTYGAHISWLDKKNNRQYLFVDNKIKVPFKIGKKKFHFPGKVINISFSETDGQLVINVVLFGFIHIKFKPAELIDIIKVK